MSLEFSVSRTHNNNTQLLSVAIKETTQSISNFAFLNTALPDLDLRWWLSDLIPFYFKHLQHFLPLKLHLQVGEKTINLYFWGGLEIWVKPCESSRSTNAVLVLW